MFRTSVIDMGSTWYVRLMILFRVTLDDGVGTGKTTVVVQILRRMLQHVSSEVKLLMTASTHNGPSDVNFFFIDVHLTILI